MKIDWAALGSVFGVSLVTTVALVGLFTLGVVGLAKREPDAGTGGGRSGDTEAGGGGGTAGGTGSGPVALARTGAYACFALCAGAVAYGIHLIVA